MLFEKKSSYYLNERAADLPPGIGPHEFRELELMLKGEKPLAMFTNDLPADMELPEADFEPFVQSGQIVKKIAFYRDNDKNIVFRYLFYALPGEEWRIEEMQAFKEAMFSPNHQYDPAEDRRIGWLLGYDESDIEAFLTRAKKIRKTT